MASKVFFDANILLDLTLERRGYFESEKLFELASNHRIEAFVTSSVIHIAAYWLIKDVGVAETKKYLLSILSDVRVIDLPHGVLVSALRSGTNGIEDAIQYHAALYHNLNYFISNDKKMKKEADTSLPVFSAKDFLVQWN